MISPTGSTPNLSAMDLDSLPQQWGRASHLPGGPGDQPPSSLMRGGVYNTIASPGHRAAQQRLSQQQTYASVQRSPARTTPPSRSTPPAQTSYGTSGGGNSFNYPSLPGGASGYSLPGGSSTSVFSPYVPSSSLSQLPTSASGSLHVVSRTLLEHSCSQILLTLSSDKRIFALRKDADQM